MAKKAKLYKYRATGKGDFPIDMLRYDRCFPMTQEDASALAAAMHAGPWVEHAVLMVSHKEPTPDRWLSFGWSISEPQVETVDL